jgi:hypothetical protein
MHKGITWHPYFYPQKLTIITLLSLGIGYLPARHFLAQLPSKTNDVL